VSGAGNARERCSRDGFLYDYFLTVVGVMMMVMVMRAVDWVFDVFSYAFETVTEGVVLAVFVVISHIKSVLLGGVDGCPSSLFYSNFFSGTGSELNVTLAVSSGLGRVFP
jgi:hypothetical protein